MRNTRIRRLAAAVAGAAAAVTLFVAYQYVKAQDQESPRPAPQQGTGGSSSPAALSGGEHTLSATIFHSNANGNRNVGPSYQPLDQPATISCLSSGGCTIGVEQHVQVGLNRQPLNGWAICTQVDGSYIGTPGCAWQGYLPTQGFYNIGSWAQQTSVSPGNHTVQTFIYTSYGVQEDEYTIIYRVYTP